MIKKNLFIILVLTISAFLLADGFELITIQENNMKFPIRINSDGTKIVGQTAGEQASVWTFGEGTTTLGGYIAVDISENGKIVGDIVNDDGIEEAAYYENDQWYPMGNIPGGGVSDNLMSTAQAISDNGNHIVGMAWHDNSTAEAFYWNETDGMTGLGQYEDTSGRANAVSNDGSIIAGWSRSATASRMPCIWVDGEIQFIDGIDFGEFSNMTSDGSYIVGTAGTAFIWSETDGYEDLGFPQGTFGTIGLGIADNKTVIGTIKEGVSPNMWHAMINPPGGEMSKLKDYCIANYDVPEDFASYTFLQANSISADGNTVAGFGFDADYNWVTWVVKMPEPATIQGNVALNGTLGNIEDVNIQYGGANFSPDAEGNYTATVASGIYDLVVSLNGYETVTIPNVETTPNETLTIDPIVLNEFDNLGTLAGTINFIGGGPEDYTQVIVTAGEFHSTPDETGNYEIPLPEGTYEVSVEAFDYITENIENVSISLGETTDLNVDLIFQYAPSYYEGTITLADANEEIDLTKAIFYIKNNVVTVNEDGSFSGSITPGVYNVQIYLEGYEPYLEENVNFEIVETINITAELEKNVFSPRNVKIDEAVALLTWDKPAGQFSLVDGFENYNLSTNMSEINAAYTTGSYVPGAQVTDLQASVGEKSVLFDETSDDVLIEMGDKTSGKYNMDFDMFVEEGNTGHFNILRKYSWPYEFAIEVFFKEDGTVKIFAENSTYEETYNVGEWFTVSNQIDLDNDEAKFLINGEELLTYQYTMNAYNGEIGELKIDKLDISAEIEPQTNGTGKFYFDNLNCYSPDELADVTYDIYLDNFEVPLQEDYNGLFYQFENLESGLHYVGLTAKYSGDVSSDMQMLEFEYEESDADNEINLVTKLSNAYPNPYYASTAHRNNSIKIDYSVAKESNVKVKIFNIRGELIKTLVNEEQEAGPHSITWNGKNSNNKMTGSGVYFYKLSAANEVSVKKLIILK